MAEVCNVCGIPYQARNEYLQHVFGNHTPEEIFDRGREEGKDSTANRIALGALVVAIGSIIAAGIVAAWANHYAKEANTYAGQSTEYAAQATELAKQSENRPDYEQDHKYADSVYLGEAPQYYYAVHEKDGNNITWVVLNGSGIEIRNVWIEGEEDTWIRIDGIQRCTMYRAPAGFVPVAVHFTDPVSVDEGFVWRRTTTGELKPDGRQWPTDEEDPDGDDGNSDDPLDVKDCSG